jgi:hypothetical protein
MRSSSDESGVKSRTGACYAIRNLRQSTVLQALPPRTSRELSVALAKSTADMRLLVIDDGSRWTAQLNAAA